MLFSSNKKMRDLCDTIPESLFLTQLEPDLKSFIEEGFIVAEGCVLFRRNVKETNPKLNSFLDKTGYECFTNKIHLEDHVASSKNPDFMTFQSLLMSLETAKSLSQVEGCNSFCCILSIDLSEEETFLQSYVFRFYAIRPKEGWLEENLEEYESAILSIKTDRITESPPSHLLSLKEMLSEIKNPVAGAKYGQIPNTIEECERYQSPHPTES